MVINNHENICLRCHIRTKFLETFKKCSFCSSKYCNQCWSELEISDEFKVLIDILPKTNNVNMKRICSSCITMLIRETLENTKIKKHKQSNENADNNDADDYHLALAMSLSQNEADKPMQVKKRVNENENISMKKINIAEVHLNDDHENLLKNVAEAIERFMNRAKSNYQRNRDVIGDTALLSAFISLQSCATDLEQLKHDLTQQRQHFETLQEKLTALRDAREAINVLRYEYHQKKCLEQESLAQQHRLMLMQKVADLRQVKHAKIANFQELYFQHLLEEEQKLNKHLKKMKPEI